MPCPINYNEEAQLHRYLRFHNNNQQASSQKMQEDTFFYRHPMLRNQAFANANHIVVSQPSLEFMQDDVEMPMLPQLEQLEFEGQVDEPSEEEINVWRMSVDTWKAKRSAIANLQPLTSLCYKALASMAQDESLGVDDLKLGCLNDQLKSGFAAYVKSSSQRILGRFAKQLLSNKSISFDFGIVKRDGQPEVWRHMVDNCPQMQTIIFRDYHGKPYTLMPIEDLLKMPKLVHIEMPDFWCNDLSFAAFALHFSKLKVLHVSLWDLSDSGLEMLQHLTELRSFDFHGSRVNKKDPERDIRIMASMLAKLSHLEELWPTYKSIMGHERPLEWLRCGQVNFPINLKKLHLGGNPGIGQKLTSVESLTMKGDVTKFLPFMPDETSFPNLQSLFLIMSPLHKKYLYAILERCGMLLKELMIETSSAHNNSAELDMSYVFKFCPKLVKFNVYGAVNCTDNYEINPEHLKYLEEFKFRAFGNHRFQVPSMVTFYCPLKILKLGPFRELVQNDLFAGLSNRVEHKGGFDQLEELWLSFEGDEIGFNALYIIKAVLCSAPKIKRLVIEILRQHISQQDTEMFMDLAQFCRYFMPDLDYVQF